MFRALRFGGNVFKVPKLQGGMILAGLTIFQRDIPHVLIVHRALT